MIKVKAIIKIRGFSAFIIIINGIPDTAIIIILTAKTIVKIYIREAKKIAAI
jgi:hypothetical protein